MSHHSPIGFIKKDIQSTDYVKKTELLSTQSQKANRLFPFLVTESFSSRIDWDDSADPLLRQILPSAKELEEQSGFLLDPLEERQFTIAPGVIKKYQGRVILQLTGACPIHCRYCFRRHSKSEDIPKTLQEWQKGVETVRDDKSIIEVIYSGGDPLMLPHARLIELSDLLAEIPHLQRLRIHTRTPVASPERITSTLINGLQSNRLVVSMVIHMNHAAEMDAAVESALAMLVDSGIPLYNQSVLLKGVNDDVDSLAALSETLLQARVTPYYLHLLDPVAGAAHFQVDERQGRELIQALRNRLPGFGVPLLVKEIPGSQAKVPL